MTDLELLTFRRSHYNEKARWALDYKGLAHTRTYLMPGPHAGRIRKIAPQSTTPVLLIDGEAVQDSDAILIRLEELAPDPALYPADEALRAEMIPLIRFFDDELGPAIRRCVFTVLVTDNRYTSAVFVDRATRAEQLVYRMALPFVKPRIMREMGVDDVPLVVRSFEIVQEALDLIAERTARTGYLVGDGFTAADLTAAALMGPGLHLTHPDMKLPEPEPSELAAMRQRWMSHPAAAWVLTMYDRHRPAPLA